MFVSYNDVFLRNTKPRERGDASPSCLYCFGSLVQCLQANYFINDRSKEAVVVELMYTSMPHMETSASVKSAAVPWFALGQAEPNQWGLLKAKLECKQEAAVPWSEFLESARLHRTGFQTNRLRVEWVFWGCQIVAPALRWIRFFCRKRQMDAEVKGEIAHLDSHVKALKRRLGADPSADAHEHPSP